MKNSLNALMSYTRATATEAKIKKLPGETEHTSRRPQNMGKSLRRNEHTHQKTMDTLKRSNTRLIRDTQEEEDRPVGESVVKKSSQRTSPS